MIATIQGLFLNPNFHTNKGTGRNKNLKKNWFAVRDRNRILFVQFGWVTNLKITRKREKDEHDQSKCKIPAKIYSWFYFGKRELEKTPK